MQKLLFVHRWGGVALALFMALWFGSGLLIILTGSPAADRAAQLAHAEQLAPQGAWLDAAQAWARSGVKGELPGEARLVRAGDTVYWLFRTVSGEAVALDATTGARHEFDAAQAVKIAEAWLAAPGESENQANVVALDLGEAPAFVRNSQGLGPFHRLAVEDGNGTEIIVSARSGEVLAAATAFSRGLYYASSWIHNFHFLDFLGETRRTVLAWAGGFAFVAGLTGLIVGWIRWRPGFWGHPTYSGGRRQPYRLKSLAIHFWAGLIGGTFATLWAFSGVMTTNPLGFFSPANASAKELAAFIGKPGATPPLHLKDSATGGLAEIVWRRLGNRVVVYGLTPEGVKLALDGNEAQFDREALLDAALRLAGDRAIAAFGEIDDYDSYYYRNRRQTALDRPLPVMRVDLADKPGSRLYIDSADGRLLLKQDSSRRAYRWLYQAIHHWDFGWLGAYRPLWYAWMLTIVSLGLTLAVTAATLAWRRLNMTYDARRIAREERATARASAAE